MSSPRNSMMTTIRNSAEVLRNSSYFVKRGAINWATFPFEEHSKAIAILIDDMSLLGSTTGVGGSKDGKISLEIAARMPDEKDHPSIDDGLMDDLIEDAETIVKDLIAAKDGDYPIVFHIDKASARVIEWHDAEVKVQGVVVMFNAIF